MAAAEETLDAVLAERGGASPEALARTFPHPFLYRELAVGDGTRKFAAEEVASRTRRFERMIGAHGGSSLLQHGPRPTDAGVLEPRIVRIRGPQGGPIVIGTFPEADVHLERERGDRVCILVSASADGLEHELLLQEGEAWYDNERLSSTRPARLEDGLRLMLGVDLGYQTFTSEGFFRFLIFREKLARARAAIGR